MRGPTSPLIFVKNSCRVLFENQKQRQSCEWYVHPMRWRKHSCWFWRFPFNSDQLEPAQVVQAAGWSLISYFLFPLLFSSWLLFSLLVSSHHLSSSFLSPPTYPFPFSPPFVSSPSLYPSLLPPSYLLSSSFILFSHPSISPLPLCPHRWSLPCNSDLISLAPVSLFFHCLPIMFRSLFSPHSFIHITCSFPYAN